MLRQYKLKKYLLKTKHSRYQNLLKIIFEQKSKSIIEIGTWYGINSYLMIETAKLFHSKKDIKYYGFDLFEKFSDEDREKELSKRPPPINLVKQKLEKTGAQINLFMGYTQEALPKFVSDFKNGSLIDFIFIDGGHSIETITSDWNNIIPLMSKNTVVVFDDYYSNTVKEVENFGCKKLIDSLNKEKYQIEILNPQNQFQQNWGLLKINLVKVLLRNR